MPTMMLSSHLFPTRTPIPNTSSGSIGVGLGTLVTLDAPPQVIALNPGNPDTKYDFLFWDANKVLVATSVVTFTTPSDDSIFVATAWYTAEGGGNGSPAVTTYAFSRDRDEVIADTPIDSVAPSAAWPGPPSTVVSTTTTADPVTITAKSLIDGSGEFASWLAFGGNASGETLTVKAQTSALGIAVFGVPQPDPCAQLRLERDSIEPGDFPTPEAFRRALAAANARLHQCERQHGEPLD
jgi:hypothetical protein